MSEERIENLPVVSEPALPARDFRAGTAALAEMPESEFEVRLLAMRRGRERIARIHRDLMDPENDYGVIPGTQKPTLLKPGAEKLCQFYGFAADFRPQIQYGDGETQPPITVLTECRLHLGTLDGPVVNTGHGAANSWEKRYRYRRGDRVCPNCCKEGTIIKGKEQYGGGWICFAKKGGCGAKFSEKAPEIINQQVGDVENTDPYDMLNTLLKMAEKRAYVDATLRATATSGLYTQDMEEAQQPERPALPAPKEEEPPVVCHIEDCGIILSQDELLGSIKRGQEFEGRFLCVDHGKAAIADWKAKQKAEAMTPRTSSEAEAAQAEKADPFISEQ